MEYTQNTYVSIIDTIRKEVAEQAESLSYAKSREIFREELSAICAEYGCQFLGFNLIRMLHNEKIHVDMQVNNDGVVICDHIFAKENIVKPSAISNEDKEKYAYILAQVACATGNWPMIEELAIARFYTLLKDNLYLQDDMKTTREVNRKDILNVARSLALSYQDTNELLFKTLECGVLSDTSAADLIECFIIENNQGVLEREDMLAEYSICTRNIRPTPIDKRKDNITQIVCDTFYETVLSVNKNVCYEDRRNLCLDYLVKNARFLDAPNRTAMLLYEKLLCYTRNAMIGQYEEVSNDKELFDRLNKYLITDDTHVALSSKERVALTQLLLSYQDYDRLEDAYNSWAIPTVNSNGELIRIELGSRMEKILRGDRNISIQKKDILFALFLACSLEWEYDNETDIEVLLQRLNHFENLANELLQNAFLGSDQFYLPHPLETGIALAIMCGPLAEGVFGDVVAELNYWSKGTKTNSTAAQKKLPVSAPDDKQQKKLSKEHDRIWKSIDGSVRNAMKKLLEINADKNIVDQITSLALAIYSVWEKEDFCGIDIYFDANGTWGYLPITSIGLSYQAAGETPEWAHSVLYGTTNLEIPFPSRIRTGKQENNTLQNIINDKLPKLDETNTRILHRKALMYLILGQMQVYGNSTIYDNLKCEAHVNSHRIMKIFGIATKED